MIAMTYRFRNQTIHFGIGLTAVMFLVRSDGGRFDWEYDSSIWRCGFRA